MTRLSALVRDSMARLQVPGAALGVWHRNQASTAAFGITNADHPLPVDETTLFHAGSISKTFAATAVMQLVEQGKLALEERVRTYLPEFRLQDEDAAERATLLNCLNHTGGWVGDYFRDTGKGDDAIERIVAKMAKSPQLTPLGATWSYNNAGFYVAGRVMEVVTGQPFETVVRDTVFRPLGMNRTYFHNDDLITYRVASGHIVTEDGPKVARPWAMFRSTSPAGGVVTCMADLLRYARFHLGDGRAEDGTRTLAAASLAAMQSPTTEAGCFADATGIAWQLRDIAGVRTVQHGGSTNGQQASLILVPSHDFAIGVLTNADRGRQLHRAVTAATLDQLLGLREPPPALLTCEEGSLSEYAGKYSAVLSDLEITANGGLVLEELRSADRAVGDQALRPLPVPPVRLGFTAPGRVVALDFPYEGDRGEFIRGPGGDIEWFRWGGRIARRQTP
ncbi:MAG: beta-lactamase family protein [Dehalococcoidia bacterium]|nr:beta-lactamase family protein [Dehalococcoidia bacterium]